MIQKKPVVLVILDGWGYSPQKEYNAIYAAHPKNFNKWLQQYPSAILAASGEAVGLPPGMMGNSAVGHVTIGCGRIIKQPITYLNQAIDDGTFFTNKLLIERFDQLKKLDKTLHILGLLSDAGVHGHEKHIHAFIRMAVKHGIKKILVHAFLDGRDTAPTSASYFLKRLENVFNEVGCGKIGSIHGRFYAMDRDEHWDRVEKSYRVLTSTQEIQVKESWQEVLNSYYARDITDEFIPPTRLVPQGYIHDNDGIIFTNTRADRARELTALLLKPQQSLHYSFLVTAIQYHPSFITDVLYQQPIVKNSLFDVLAQHHKSIFSIAESEKYAHVTYFFNGGREITHPHEERVIIPSIPKKDYVHIPKMSAVKITDAVINSLDNNMHDFYLINYANADMVGHSGNFEATIQAIQCIDKELERLYEYVVKKYDGTLYITGDHGNAEDRRMGHTTNPVYFLMLTNNITAMDKTLPMTQLKDIAPFILQQLQLKIPQEMS